MTHRRPRVAVVGGGHNGLTAAAYLARAGIGVTVFERSDHFGGAAISARPFADVDANLSRYAYLVSLLPASIAADLGLDVRLARRRFSSYTPRPGTATGLLVDAADPVSTAASFAAAGAAGDSAGLRRLLRPGVPFGPCAVADAHRPAAHPVPGPRLVRRRLGGLRGTSNR